jgi:cytochrome c oxidase cbb3-type subunit I/II
MTLAYDAKVNYEDVFSQVRMWDTITYNTLKKKHIVIPPKKNSKKDEQYAGAYVKDPILGMHQWVASFDLNSLYPHLIMMYNLALTAKKSAGVVDDDAEAPALEPTYTKHISEHWHRKIERKPVPFLILTLVVILIGGLIELIPTFLVKSNVPTISSVKPYSPLELQGRDIYVREGCYNCHSQMIRPFRSETERYGEYSKAGEFVYDHPFQWGSKRTGPDLAREGSGNLKKSNTWQYNHLEEPSAISTGSVMPSYAFLIEHNLDTTNTAAKINAMRTLGVPYDADFAPKANAALMLQAKEIAASLKKDGIEVPANKEMIAMIAYLQRLGTDINKK